MQLRKRHAPAFLAVLAFGTCAAQVRAEPPAIASKEAEARQVLAQVAALDGQLDHSVEAYDRARWQLGQTKRSLKGNARRLAMARRQLARAQRVLAQRAVSIYESGQQDATLELLLGARSLRELLDEYDAVRRVAAVDVKIVRDVTAFRARVERERDQLRRARRRETRLVAQAAAERASIRTRIAERQRLLTSVKGEIAHLQAEERARQERLRREALARLAAQRAAERRAVELARRQAEAAARAAAERRQAEARRQQLQESQRRQQLEESQRRQQLQQQSQPQVVAPQETATVPAPTTTTAATETQPPPPQTTVVGVVAQTPEGASVAPPPSHGDVVDIAMRYLGVPYQWGGASPATGFDCSGFVMFVYAQVGVALPHYSAGQYGYGVPISKDQLQPGDLVFFDGLDHVGIYVGGGQFVHAPHTGDLVKISSLSEDWYAQTYVGARRL